ncbi:MAG: S-layer homology domain-containing protein [Lachnospiraceae bacterium]|nr:S-layer homology domain-containing protein [Lachnospiraceae bacterium]
MKQKLRSCKRGFAWLLAVALVFTSVNLTPLTAEAAQTPVGDEYSAVFGLVASYVESSKAINVVWGNNTDYTTYTVTITGKDTTTEYSKVYPEQNCVSHDYVDAEHEYEAGKTYTVELQGEKDGKYSAAISAEVKIPGGESGEEGGEGEEELTVPNQPVGLVAGYHDVDDANKGKIRVVWGAYSGSAPEKWTIYIDDEEVGTATQVSEQFFTNKYAEGTHAVKLIATNAKGDSEAATATFTIGEGQAGEEGGEEGGGETEEVSKTDLNAAIDAALTEEALAAYTEETVADYKAKLAAAKTVAEKEDATQDEVNEALSALNAAKTALVEKEGENDGAVPSYTTVGENLATSFEGKHEDWVDWSNAEITAYPNNSTVIAVTGYEGYEGYQTRAEQTGLTFEAGKNYVITYDITSTADKKTLLHADQPDKDYAVVIDDYKYDLTANKRATVTVFTGKLAEAKEGVRIFTALGMIVNDDAYKAGDHTITIQNFSIYEIEEDIAYAGYCVDSTNTNAVDEVLVDVVSATDTWTADNGAGTDLALTTEDGVHTLADITSGSEWYQPQIQSKFFEVEEGVDYIFSVKYKLEGTSNNKLKYIIQRSGSSDGDWTVIVGEGPQEITYDSAEADDDGYVTYTKEFTAAADKDNVHIVFGLGDSEASGATFSFKDATLVAKTTQSADAAKKGDEYDFSDTENNEKYDYKDPGKVKEGYTLIFDDEFDGDYGSAKVDADTGLNLDNWAYQLGDGTIDCGNTGWGNAELQAYTGNKKNIAVNEDLTGDGKADGLLRITASYEESPYVYETESAKNYTSARIRSTKPDAELFNNTYGYVEARISLPETKGAWPAFWMLPQSTNIYGGWPVSGEIDIMETVGSFGNDVHNQACGTLHFGAPDHVYKGSGYVDLDSDIKYFHTYAVDWAPGEISWYYDGVKIYTMSNWKSGFSGASDSLSFDAPFDQPFYMLLNLAVDSGRFGGANNKAAFQEDINMYVDYVRVYQKTDGYADYAERGADGSAKEDWADYAGKNQIAEIADGVIATPNVDRDSDKTKWYVSENEGGAGSATIVKDANNTEWAKVAITTAGSQDYSVQLIGHYDAKAGYSYKVSFDAYADGDMVGKTVNCDSKEWSGWSTYGIQSFVLKDTATPVEYKFNQVEDFNDCRIEFNLGAKGTGNVYISNVKVEIIDPSELDSESAVRTALANGNVLYNSTFDQGSKHIGYWKAMEGTTLSVPRYTTEALTEDDVKVVDVASKTNYENIADGVKYYERRAQISAEAGTVPGIYQNGFDAKADSYTLRLDMYSGADTDVTAAIYTTAADGTPKRLATGAKIAYKAADKVKSLTWKFDLEEEVKDAALVLTFDDGASVQVDNVVLIGESQGEEVDPNPLNSDSTWAVYDGGTLSNDGDVHTVTGATSGGAWYNPQIVSSPDYSLVAGNKYKFSVDFKMSGTSNNTAQYIIQENSGSWHVYNNGPTTITYNAYEADGEGYVHYETTFTADVSLKTVHTVFGLGNSEASNATFVFKNADISLVEEGGGEGGQGDTWVPIDEDITAALEAEVADAEAIDTDAYTEETVAALETALQEAKAVLENEEATEKEIQDALDKLEAAVAALVEKEEPEEPVKTDDLKAAIDENKELDTSNYTEESVAAFEEALAAAEKVLADENATQEDVDKALKALNDAKEALEEKEAGKKSVIEIFDDIKEGQWWVDAVQFVYDNGIMAGKGANFRPTGNITREEFVQTLYNSAGSPDLEGSAKDFPDVKAGEWYENAVKWANENDIANGTGNGTFGVGKKITRQDMALMLYKYAKKMGYDTTFTDGTIDDFSDSAKVSAYAREALSWAVSQGIMSGKGAAGAAKSEMRLDPVGNATRAECASMMMKLVQANTQE